ncbi:MAG: SRPBCC family protein [Bacteroidetes bacterium]|nr:SRPBCC family protein [Bacteroidota bacterium]
MKILKWILYVVLFLIAALLVLGLVLPKSYKVERTVVINAPKQAVWEQVYYWKNFNSWSPWAKLDTAMKQTITGNDGEVGSVYHWTGNDQVGEGEMKRLELQDMKSIKNHLHFIKPFESEANVYHTLEGEDGKVTLSWGMTGENGFMARIFMFLMGGIDKAVGGDYERGLKTLKEIVENPKNASGAGWNPADKIFKGGYFAIVQKIKMKMSDINQSVFSDAYTKVGAYMEKHGMKSTTAPLAFYMHWDSATQTSDVGIGMGVDKTGPAEGGVMVAKYPDMSAASLDYYGNYTDPKMKEAYGALATYIMKSGKIPGSTGIEEYITDPGEEKDPSKWLTRIYMNYTLR